MEQLTHVLAQLHPLLGDLETLIAGFHHVVNINNINVITDAMGHMDIEVPTSMPNNIAQEISTQLRDLDVTITAKGEMIDRLIRRGLNIERDLRANNPNFTSYLITRIEEFKELNRSYNH